MGAEDLARFEAGLGVAADRVAAGITARSRGGKLPPLTRIQVEALALVPVVEALLEALPADAAVRGELTAIRHYAVGFLQGGGIAFGLATEAGEVAAIVRSRLAFLSERVRPLVCPPAEPPALSRLDFLLAFAEEMNVRVKNVPASPSDTWMVKMEAKLREMADKRGLPFPVPPAAPAPAAAPVSPPAPPRSASPSGPPSVAPTTRRAPASAAPADEVAAPRSAADGEARSQALVQRATEAGLDLGRVPPVATEEWLAATEKLLEAAIAKRKAVRKAERLARDAERKARIERIQSQADELGVDIGPFPAFPTEDWLARLELRIVQESNSTTRQGASPARGARLAKVLAAGRDLGVTFGEVSANPDDTWLAWAEARVEETRTRAVTVAPPKPMKGGSRAWVVYEEGTIQEKAWPLNDALLTIGRGRGSTVQILDDVGVSRKHCSIREERGRFWLRDEGSTKGTLVNGEVLAECELTGGERITCGDSRFVFKVR